LPVANSRGTIKRFQAKGKCRNGEDFWAVWRAYMLESGAELANNKPVQARKHLKTVIASQRVARMRAR
jgi:hypothetical protein